MTKLPRPLALATLLALPALSALAGPAPAVSRNEVIDSFNDAKRIAARIHQAHPFTIYCGCRYEGKKIDLQSCGYKPRRNPLRAARLEWEHVVPAEAFGHSFAEWRDGAPQCQKRKGRQLKVFKGRKCAETNPEFNHMEGDLYNLWPEIGELNGLRSNYSMAELPGSDVDFGGCQVKLQDRKFEPAPEARGIVARTYLYMDQAYPGRGIVSDKNRPLFEAWNRQYPVTDWECERARRIQAVQKNVNPILAPACASRPASGR